MIHSQRELEDMLDTIEQRGENLTDWESQFVDSMTRQEGNFSYKQATVIDRIYEQKVAQ